MTPKEKAKELIDKYLKEDFRLIQEYIPIPIIFSKDCALIVVDEIINELNENNDSTYSIKRIIFWGEVKEQIKADILLSF